MLSRYKTIERIPPDPADWDVKVRGAAAMSESLESRPRRRHAIQAARTLRLDVPIHESLDDLRWRGVPRDEYITLCDELGFGA